MKDKKTKKEAADDQNQNIFPQLLSLYRKRCDLSGVVINLTVKQTIDKAIETNKLDTIKLSQIIGPAHIRGLFEALIDTKYYKIKNISIWKSKIGDEGMRNICKYLELGQNNTLQILDVLENQITDLGCLFLGKILSLPYTKIKHLKMDNNLIGNKGIQNLSIGLKINSNLTKLSLKYCGITSAGIKYLQSILANIHTKIRSIKLQGNPLGNEGIYQFLRVVQLNQMLQKVNIADTGLNLLNFVAKSLYVIEQGNNNDEEQQQEDDQDKPQKKQTPLKNVIENVKQVVLPNKIDNVAMSKQKTEDLKSNSEKKKKIHQKVTRTINEDDYSLQANIMRLLAQIMSLNILIRKYDLRFNPISNDAAFILFQIIQHNSQIKDVQINVNVDAQLRENLDTLMRKRTGRLPKGRGRPKKKKK